MSKPRTPVPGNRRVVNVLVTGATGIVGHEVAHVLEHDGHRVVRTSRRGAPNAVAWDIGTTKPPPSLAGRFDVLVHCAANIRWNMSQQDAWRANVDTTERLLQTVSADRVIHMSTLFAHSQQAQGVLAGYRNTYEWSKAESERVVFAHSENAIVVRPPLIIGRRADGFAARFSGLYTIVRASLAGLLPMIVGKESAPVDIVSSDDVAAVVTSAIDDAWPPGTIVRLGRSYDSLRLTRVNEIAFDALNVWRTERGVDPIPTPRIVNPESWSRFYRPLAERYLSTRQRRAIEVFEPFAPYLAIETPLAVDLQTPDIGHTLSASVRYWASQNQHLATKNPHPWQMATSHDS